MTGKKKAIISHIFKYASAQYFSQFLGFFIGIFMRKFLGPVYMGVYGLLKIILEYGSYASMGTDTTLCYKLPMLRGQGNESEASRLNTIIFNFVMTASFIYSLSVLVFAVASRKHYSLEIFVGLLATSVLIILLRVSSYYITVLRAYKDFSVLSFIIVFEAAANLLLTVFIVSKFKIYGLYFSILIMPVLIIICIMLLTTQRLKFSFDFKGIVAYIKFSVPLFLKDILNVILNSVDRIMIAGMLGLEQLGFYSIALMVKSYGGDVMVNSFANVIQPYFMEAVGRSDGSDTVQRYVIISSQVTAYLMSFILSCIYIIATPFVYYVLPKFTPGLTAMRVFLIATFFMTICGYYYDYLVAVNKQLKTIPITLIAITLSVTLNYMSIKRGYGISGCAASTAIAAFLLFTMTSLYALAHLQNKKGMYKSCFGIFIPLLYSALIVVIVTHVITMHNLVLEALARLIVYFTTFLPALYYLDKETGVVMFFIKMVSGKLKKRGQT